MTTPKLRASGIVKKFRHFQLGPIDIQLSPGTATGLLGANGAGKTTLLNCLAGQMSPDVGTISWGNREISLSNWKVREHIGFVGEIPSLYDSLSAQDHLLFASRIFENWDHAFAEKWLKKFDLPPRQKVHEYSKGMKVKLSILIAISHRADLLLLDEPTSGLDPDTRYEMQLHFRDLVATREVCMLLSSHLFEDIENVTSEVKIINRGKIVRHLQLSDLDNLIYIELDSPDETRKLYIPTDGLAFAWKKGARECLLLKKDELPRIQKLAQCSSYRKARLEDFYFGSQESDRIESEKTQTTFSA